MFKVRTNIRSFLTLAFFVLAPLTAQAQIRVEKITIGLDGYIRGDRWAPIVFQISNYGPAFQGTIEVLRGRTDISTSQKTIFRKSLELGPSSKRKIEMLVYIPNYSESMQFRILNSNNEQALEGRLDPRTLNYQDNMVLVVSDGDFNHQFLSGAQNPWGGKTFVGYLRPEDLFSQFIAYSTADAIAIGSISTSQLDPEAWKALLLYGATGGTLVVSAFTDFSVIQDSAIKNFFPSIHPELSEITHGEFLSSGWIARSTEPFPELAIPAQQVQPRTSDMVLAEIVPGKSLITSTPFYKGNIIYFAFDYSRMPESIRVQFAKYWNDVIFPTTSAPPMFGVPYRPRLEDNPRVQKDLYDIPGLKLPDMKWFALFFFAYLLAIGPAQYFALNLLKKNALLWTTFPLIIVIFTSLAIGYSKFRHAAEGKITQVAVIEAFPALETQAIYQVYGSAVSESGQFDFQAIPENSYLTKAVRQAMNYQFEPFVLIEDLPHTLSGESLKTWTFRTFDAISSQPESNGIRITTQTDGSKLYGTIVNGSSKTLQESFFYYDRLNSATLQTIEPGETRRFEIELNNRSAMPMTEPHLRTLLDLGNSSHTMPHFFLGEVQNSKGEIKINGKSQETECTKYIAVYDPASK